jgi:rhodanese-related sulfurtransferase
MKLLITIICLATFLSAGKYDKVKITEELSQVLVYHKGKSIKIHRIQDVKNHLTGSYAKISRPCPDKCIQPISIGNGIETIGEVEVVEFVKNQVNHHKGALIDARPKDMYEQETIPAAINIPFTISNNNVAIKSIFEILGMTINPDSSWDSSKALDVVVYCNGPWCEKSKTLIDAFLREGYPAKKIFYYRGGFQMWKSLGLTTVKTK